MTGEGKANLLNCYNAHGGVSPAQLKASGVMFWYGQRVTLADFRAIKRDGMASERFD